MKAIVLAGATVAVALAVALAISTLLAPHCPTEDSCYPDYAHGVWTIIEGDPPLQTCPPYSRDAVATECRPG